LLVAIGVFVFFGLARDAFTSALLFIVILLALVVIHEFAHFATAKMFGILVHEFGVGFPPKIWGRKFGETVYTINWLPIGGFVRLEGEEDPSDPRALASKPAWQRLIVITSGAFANLALPVLLFGIALMIPHEIPAARAVVTSVVEGAPAQAAGLQTGDVIHSIDGRNTKNVPEASRYVRLGQGREIEFLVRREGEPVTIAVLSRWAPPSGQGPTGITIGAQYPFTETEALAPWEAFPQGVRQTWDTLILARNEIIGWFKGSGGPQFAGPVGIASVTGDVARSSDTPTGAISPLLGLAALLSINLGVLNLLPLPMLDGGRATFILIEIARRGRRIAPEKEAMVHFAGFVAFIALALVITYIDISRIANGESLFR
jgi:regulator of sigma E protease